MFKVGDVVEAFGCRGEVTRISPDDVYPVLVEFNGNDTHYDSFTTEGKSGVWHKEPSLKLIERPEEKIELTWSQIEKELNKFMDRFDYGREHLKKSLGFKE